MITLQPSQLNGALTVRPSKSYLHRYVICAALAEGVSTIHNFRGSNDIDATLGAMRALGLCEYQIDGDICTVAGNLRHLPEATIDCGESGSTLRFLLPLACDGSPHVFTGSRRLFERPLLPYETIFAWQGVQYVKDDNRIKLHGTLHAGQYALPGDVSSQFVTGLLFKLPLLPGESVITVTSKLESAPYVDITRQCLTEFGIETMGEDQMFNVRGNQKYIPSTVFAEGDYSHAAFFVVAAAIGGTIILKGLKPASLQGDREILNIVKCFGAEVTWEDDTVTVRRKTLQPIEMDVSDIPDLVPAIAVLACATEGKTVIRGAKRLRFKESDRLSAMAGELEKLGADIVEYEDSLVINGTGSLAGGAVSAHNDHRIAMALSIASCISEHSVTIDQPESVSKSAPEFYDEFRALGGKIN